MTVWQDGKIHFQRYEHGEPTEPLKVVGETEKHGTKIRFMPSDTIFETTQFSFDTLHTRFREMAFLNAGIRIYITDERTGIEKMDHYEGGVVSFVQFLNKNKETLHPDPIYVTGVKDDNTVEVAMQYNDSYNENIFTFLRRKRIFVCQQHQYP